MKTKHNTMRRIECNRLNSKPDNREVQKINMIAMIREERNKKFYKTLNQK